jgi:hypothetical protein
VDFLKAGSLVDFQKVMQTGETRKFKGKIYLSVWGIPEAADDTNL